MATKPSIIPDSITTPFYWSSYFYIYFSFIKGRTGG